jgi:hypothetical protein
VEEVTVGEGRAEAGRKEDLTILAKADRLSH